MKSLSVITALLLVCHNAFADTATGSGGVTIHYDRAGSGKPALVFVHGWSCDRSYWAKQFDAFASEYTVINLDLAGHGDSGSNRDDWSIAAFGADVAAVVSAAELYDVVLVGHSMGGPVVIDAARRLGDRVDLVVAVDTLQEAGNKPMSEKESRELWAPFANDYAAMTEGFVRSSFFLPESPPELVERVATDMAAADPAIALEAGNGLTTWDHRKGIKAIRDVPFVLLNADYRPTDREALLKLHPDARVAIVGPAGHFPMMEMPREFNDILGAVVEVVADP